ncbi:MAG TPA: TonB family protein [Chitinophagaceae bacterium]|nr:TonB family protein [Chitinophagaceae bacterium]
MSSTLAENQFEKNKNLKAAGLTAAITAAIFLVFFLASWTLPQLPPQPVDLGVEVNLGNSDQGLGDVAPASPGEPNQSDAAVSNPPQSTPQAAETQPEVIPNNDENATPVNTSPKPEKKETKSTVNSQKPKKTKVVKQTPPAPPKPKAQMGTLKKSTDGGNNRDDFNKVRDQGIAGGHGDQGKQGGNPNSDNYTGNPGTGNGGISITDGLAGRRVAGNFHFEDSYSHGGTVLVRVTVDENGKVTNAVIDLPSGNPEIDQIAVRRARQVTFTKGNGVQTGRLKIRFENPKG